MTQLTNLNIPPSIPSSLAEFVQLRVGHKAVKEINEGQLKRECASIIARAFTYSSPNWMKDFKGTPDEIKKQAEDILFFQATELFTALKGKYSQLTIPEVQRAFKMGLDGLSGPYFGMCGKTYSQFLKYFYELPDRGKAWLAYMNELEKPKDMIIEKKTPEQERELCIIMFNRYKEGSRKSLGYGAWTYYDALCREWGNDYEVNGKTIKTLCADQAIRISIYNQCKASLLIDLKDQKVKYRLAGKPSMAEAIDKALEQGIDGHPTLEKKTKEAYIKWFFDDLLSKNQTL